MFYIEYHNGNCTVVEADDQYAAMDIAGNGLNPWDRVSLLRPATDEDVAWFLGQGGEIR